VASPWQGTLWWHHPGRKLHDGIALAGCSAVAQPWQGTLQGRGCGGSRVTPRAPPQPPGAAAGLVPPCAPPNRGAPASSCALTSDNDNYRGRASLRGLQPPPQAAAPWGPVPKRDAAPSQDFAGKYLK